MNCPLCNSEDTKVLDSRLYDCGTAIRRRRECKDCSGKFRTVERIDSAHKRRISDEQMERFLRVLEGIKGRLNDLR